MTEHVILAREAEADIIWDQTSTTITSRKKKFNMLPNYKMIAVVFPTPDPLELSIRLKNRPGKEIPQDVLNSMIDGWEEPSADEGFDEIWMT
jgi:tRNA uridine 5-carbamoylmethylation protein Kti12